MNNEQNFDDEALKYINNLNDLLDTRISSTGLSRKDCIKAHLERPKAKKFTEIEYLGFAAVVYHEVMLCLKRKQYKQFFIAQQVLTMLIDHSTETDKSDYAQNILSEFSKANAIKRHAETYAIKNDVIEYWKANIDPKLSNEKAAEIVNDAHIVKLSFRKIVEYISEAKKAKNIRPAA